MMVASAGSPGIVVMPSACTSPSDGQYQTLRPTVGSITFAGSWVTGAAVLVSSGWVPSALNAVMRMLRIFSRLSIAPRWSTSRSRCAADRAENPGPSMNATSFFRRAATSMASALTRD